MTNASVAPQRASDIEVWADEADVVVVGFGAAGCAAAIDARAAGADVIVLERASAAGGAAALSDGMIYLGGGTPLQQAAGFDDSIEAMKAFLLGACGPGADAAKIDFYCERSLEHHDWLTARGVEFTGTFLGAEGGGASPREGESLMYTGGENAAPFDELATPAPRAHCTTGAKPGGARLMQVLSDAALQAGAQARYDTRAERLVVDDHGAVVGVIATQYGAEVAVRARGGVVLTAGGFIFNDDMLTQYAPQLKRTPVKLGTPGDDGRGIRMAQAVGAQVKLMDAGECALPFNSPRSLVRGILVNRLGRRFVNEDTYMGRVGQRAFFDQDGETYLIVDEANYAANWLGVTAAWVAPSATELEAEIGLPAGSLVTTLDYYNAHAADGDDPLFGKRKPHLVELEPPYAAFDLRMDKFPHAVFTLGGLHTLPTGEVLDLDGERIPGLYAAGRTTSGIAAHGYCSGLSLGDSTLFGRLAGQSAAGAKA
jgi:3-oxo-5alpha-steroid 4-dehydrogenase